MQFSLAIPISCRLSMRCRRAVCYAMLVGRLVVLSHRNYWNCMGCPNERPTPTQQPSSRSRPVPACPDGALHPVQQEGRRGEWNHSSSFGQCSAVPALQNGSGLTVTVTVGIMATVRVVGGGEKGRHLCLTWPETARPRLTSTSSWPASADLLT